MTQLLITVLALLGIALMGAMAVVPTVMDLRSRQEREPRWQDTHSTPAAAVREDHDLAS